MIRFTSLAAIGFTAMLAAPGFAQHAQTNAVAVDPNDSSRVWVCNMDNNTVSCIDTVAGSIVSEIPVGNFPRSLAFNSDGTKLFVANQRGNIARETNFVTPFLKDGSEKRGTVSVIDTGAFSVSSTIDLVGVEPYAVVVAPNGEYFGVTGYRSGTVKFYDADAPHSLLTDVQFPSDLSHLPVGETILTADSNKDFVADQGTPRALTIQSGSSRVFVSHHVSPFITVLDLSLDGGGKPTGVSASSKINLNDYAFDVFFNPTPVQTLQSQGVPRFLADIALSPDGTRALVPHFLFNTNHDVNFDFTSIDPSFAGDFANRVYPSLTVLDTVNLSYNSGGDTSNRLHHELSDPLDPAAHVPYGGQGNNNGVGLTTLGGDGSPLLGGQIDLNIEGTSLGDFAFMILGTETSVPLGSGGTLLCQPTKSFTMGFSKSFSRAIPNNPALEGVEVCFQAVVYVGPTFSDVSLSNGIRTRLGSTGYGAGKMGHRAGHPEKVLYNAAGDRAIMLNRGSEDVFMYEVNGSDLELISVFPPRNHHVERAALDTTTPMGDVPLGMALVDDASTVNDDALLYIINEGTRTLSRLRVDWAAGTIAEEAGQITTIGGPDELTLSERLGQEIFEDASRAQTTGRFNNSCGSCHFEGGDDRVVWQRPAGPRSTMPMYGGTRGTGLILWKAVRMNLGETGPMFGGENGGHGLFSDVEQQGLIDFHEVLPVPLNPNLDQVTGDYTALAAEGKDLFFGTDDSGTNPTLRFAGCEECHPDENLSDPFGDTVRFYTFDFLPSLLTDDPNGIENNDPDCTQLQENVVGLAFRNVNSGANIDTDMDMMPDVDRNADGYDDRESYAIMNVDADDDFQRDDPNGYLCPEDTGDPNGPKRLFTRNAKAFSIPTKLGVFASGPYMHDHVVISLRTLLDPYIQADQDIIDFNGDTDPTNDQHPLYATYGDPSLPTANKNFNEFHDIRGDETFEPLASKVQLNLQSVDVDLDIERILAYIQSL